MNPKTFANRRVLITGHTGFKGAWLAQWLLELGAEVVGFSDAQTTSPALADLLDLNSHVHCLTGDICDRDSLVEAIEVQRPEFIFHLAAQAFVRQSYRQPWETIAVNSQGTVNLLEAIRQVGAPCVAVFVTTDKCYQNREWYYGYREDDPLGGNDPYSASKAMAEIAITAYRTAFFSKSSETPPAIRVGSARAGNVIGGGDWAADRILPDCMRSLAAGQPIAVRNPRSTRPWQHVLDAVGGYLTLADRLSGVQSAADASALCSAFNFGPSNESNRSVEELVDEIFKHWPGTWQRSSEPGAPAESKLLALCSDKAHQLLGWRGLWDFSTAVQKTVEWYRRVAHGASPREVTLEQIRQYQSDLARPPSSEPASDKPSKKGSASNQHVSDNQNLGNHS